MNDVVRSHFLAHAEDRGFEVFRVDGYFFHDEEGSDGPTGPYESSDLAALHAVLHYDDADETAPGPWTCRVSAAPSDAPGHVDVDVELLRVPGHAWSGIPPLITLAGFRLPADKPFVDRHSVPFAGTFVATFPQVPLTPDAFPRRLEVLVLATVDGSPNGFWRRSLTLDRGRATSEEAAGWHR